MKSQLMTLLACTIMCGCMTIDTVHETRFEEDTVSVLRNPCMGWGVYDDADGRAQKAGTYWKAQREAAEKYASFFYIRYRWSEMEPEEGKYAWIYDEEYKQLIQGAKDRGLKLCFRIYYNSQDNISQATPDYVRQAGAEGYMENGQQGPLWTPYPDDPVFQEKLAKFVEAFAREYDDPDVVDFVDAVNVGFWGECHNIRLSGKRNTDLNTVLDQITTIWSSHFKHVMLVLPFGSQFGFENEKRIAIEPKGYSMRRDGLGSQWFGPEQQETVDAMYGKTLLIGESCWWKSCSDDFRPWEEDPVHKLNNWRDVYELTYRHAMEGHFNTLDLRELAETKGWTTRAEDLVKSFCIKGGYRIHPTLVSFPETWTQGKDVCIKHNWINTGNGYLPNNVKNWNCKYKPAFALLDDSSKVISTFVDIDAEPSTWLHDEEHEYVFHFVPENLKSGKYHLGIALVDRSKENVPALKLAVENPEIVEGWYIAGNVVLN